MKLDVNCDLGEGEPLARTSALLRWVTSANVACGGHAGDARTMRACVRLARQFGVRLGAHPGPWSRGDQGRGVVRLTPAELELLLLQQVGALEKIARADGVKLHHIKLHGALYHASDADERLAQRYVAAVRRWWPEAIIYARAGGRVARVARRAGVRVWEEAFVDRGYRADGTLVPRQEPNALLTRTAEVFERLVRLRERSEIIAASGERIKLRAQTLCVHSDTPRAVAMVRAIAKTLGC